MKYVVHCNTGKIRMNKKKSRKEGKEGKSKN
jgi:hypothetical protein